MKKLLILIALIMAIVLLPQRADAAEVSQPSASLATTNKSVEVQAIDMRVTAVKNVFKRYNSPLVEYAGAYVKYADKHGVDWKLLPAISGLESSFGVHLMPGSYNAYGWGGGHIYFESWENGIDVINKALRANYMDKWGAKDVWEIGPIYAESPTWSVRVNFFMKQIDEEYLKLSTFTMAPSV